MGPHSTSTGRRKRTAKLQNPTQESNPREPIDEGFLWSSKMVRPWLPPCPVQSSRAPCAPGAITPKSRTSAVPASWNSIGARAVVMWSLYKGAADGPLPQSSGTRVGGSRRTRWNRSETLSQEVGSRSSDLAWHLTGGVSIRLWRSSPPSAPTRQSSSVGPFEGWTRGSPARTGRCATVPSCRISETRWWQSSTPTVWSPP